MPDRITLAEYYRTLTDAKLLNLKREGGFTAEAERVLEEEIERRDLDANDPQGDRTQSEPTGLAEVTNGLRKTGSSVAVLARSKWFALGGIPLRQIGPLDSGLISLLSLFLLGVAGALSIPVMEGIVFLQSGSLLLPNGPGDFGNFPFPLFGIGASLGITLAIYFVFVEGQKSVLSVAVLLVSCTLAFPVSVLSGFLSPLLLRIQVTLGSSYYPPRMYFIPGCVGAVSVLGGALIAFVSNFRRDAPLRILLWSIGGGALGVLEEIAMTANTGGKARLFDPLQMAPFTIWPTGVALLLGLCLHFERKRSGVVKERDADRSR